MSASNSGLTAKAERTMARYRMLPPGACVIAAFSGGADSMALLHVLAARKSELGLTIVAAHVNHGIRGGEARRDETFCRRVCEDLGIPLRVLDADVPALSAESGESLETCGRRVRYEFFRELAEEQREALPPGTPVKIATAHTASDAVETLIFHLVRGAGLNGLTGIPPVRDDIVRPLIDCTRTEVEDYCRDHGLSFVEDSTNEDPGYARNYIRNTILPELNAVNPAATQNLLRCMDLLRTDESCLSGLADELAEQARLDGEEAYDMALFRAADRAVSSRALLRILTAACGGIVPEARHIDAILVLPAEGGQVQIPSGAYVTVSEDRLTCRYPDDPDDVPPFAVPLERPALPEPGTAADIFRISVPTGTLRLELRKNEGPLPAAVLENALDYDKILPSLTVRNRRPGDRFRPAGRGVNKAVKQLFTEQNVPVPERSRRLFLESGGTVVFLEGFGTADGFRPAADTGWILVCSVER